MSNTTQYLYEEVDLFIISHWKEKLKKNKDGKNVREVYLYILLILENTVHLFICGLGDGDKTLLLTRHSNNDYHIEDIPSSSEV